MRLALGMAGLLLFAAAQPADSAVNRQAGRSCVTVASLIAPAVFARYPAPVWRGHWRTPDVRTGQAHLYRTVVSLEGHGPPNYAGHIKLASHGCRAGMTCPFFVNLQTGKVTFAPSLRSVYWNFEIAEVPGVDDLRLIHRPESRLLVTVGTRNEDARANGVSLFEWRETGPRLIRFVPDAQLCHDRKDPEGLR